MMKTFRILFISIINLVFLAFLSTGCSKEDDVISPAPPIVDNVDPKPDEGQDSPIPDEENNDGNSDDEKEKDEGNETPDSENNEGDDSLDDGETDDPSGNDNQNDESYNPHIELPLPLPIPELDAPSVYRLERDNVIEDPFIEGWIWKYDVLLPPSYHDSKDKTYPVLFLLHGKDGNGSVWCKSFQIDRQLDYCHLHFGLPEIIVVMADAANSYYMNYHQGAVRYEDFFFDYFLPEIKSKYRVTSDPQKWMIGGYSMGGYGATYYALKYYNIFGFCYAMSTPLDGKGKSTKVPTLFDYMMAMTKENMPWFTFDDGKSDYFVNANRECDKLLDKLELPHEFIFREGSHQDIFWKEATYIMLDRINRYLKDDYEK